MGIERLTKLDELMLWPDEIWPQDIGALLILDGRDAIPIERAREVVASRLHLAPRLRQVLHTPPRRLGPPLWIDASTFDIREHVGVCTVDPPGGEPELLTAVEHLRRRRLDRNRPLWEMWLLDGLAGGQVGMFVRVHHCIADGMAGVATMASLLDSSPGEVIQPPQPWAPVPPPTEYELYEDKQRRRAGAAHARVAALAHPLATIRRWREAGPALWDLIGRGTLPSTSLDRVVGGDRRLALVRSELETVRQVAHAHGAKVNDVLLSAIAGGLRALLRSRGELARSDVMRIYVPVSLHRGDPAQARGNSITEMVVQLPVGVEDPEERLRRTADETAARKARARPVLAGVPHRGLAGRAFLKLIDRQRVNVASADIHGPEVPLYFAGARVVEVFPLGQLLGKNSLSVAAMSYAGSFDMMVLADYDGYPDLDVFADGLRSELLVLASRLRTQDAA